MEDTLCLGLLTGLLAEHLSEKQAIQHAIEIVNQKLTSPKDLRDYFWLNIPSCPDREINKFISRFTRLIMRLPVILEPSRSMPMPSIN